MKKGFTLTEMLTVIIVLGLIMIIAYPIITSSISGYRDELYIAQVENIIDAAKSYVADNIDSFPCSEAGGKKDISLSTLTNEGYINDSLIDPTTNSSFSSTSKVIIMCEIITEEESDGSNYKYTYKFSES